MKELFQKSLCSVRNKSVCLIFFKSKVVFVLRLYLTGSLLLGMHPCGLHVYDRRKVSSSIRSGKSHRGVNGVICQCNSCQEMSPWRHKQVSFVFSVDVLKNSQRTAQFSRWIKQMKHTIWIWDGWEWNMQFAFIAWTQTKLLMISSHFMGTGK